MRKDCKLLDRMSLANQLANLNATLDECQVCCTVERNFRHVPGGGWINEPEAMFVFINPTVGNVSAAASWPGVRFPFAGKPKLWQILAEAGLVEAELPNLIATLGATPAMVEHLITATHARRLYMTNAVKCVDVGSSLPRAARLAEGWKVLQAEIAIVRPKTIIAFGLIPFQLLAGHTVRLADALWAAEHDQIMEFTSKAIDGRTYPLFPCYFPTGRGNPVAATRMLKAFVRHRRAALQRSNVGE